MDDSEFSTSIIDDGVADTSIKKRPRKKHLYSQILKQMEFYFSDANLRKDRFLSQLLETSKNVPLDVFLRFNKIRSMTNDVKEIATALGNSNLLKISEDGRSVYRTSKIKEKANIGDCIIYVEQLPPDANHEWVSGIFSAYGKVEYVSIPKYKNRAAIKGFAFVEFDTPDAAKKALEAFGSVGCCLPPQMPPEELCSIATYEKEEHDQISQQENELLETSEGATEKQRKKSGKDKTDLSVTEQKLDKRPGEEEFDEPKPKKIKLDHSANEKSMQMGKKQEIEPEEDTLTNNEEGEMENPLSKKIKKRKLVSEGECEAENSNQELEIHSKKKKKKKSKDREDELDEESMQDNQVEKKKKHKHRSEECCTDTKRDSEEMEPDDTKETSDSQLTKKKKKKKKCEVDVNSDSEDMDNDEGTIERKATDEEQEIEAADDLSAKKKRSRKRNKSKKKKEADHTYGLKIISKAEWSRLRNKYLNLQHEKMQALKKHLARKKFGGNYQSPYQCHENVNQNSKSSFQDVKTEQKSETSKISYTPGIIIKVNLPEPLQDATSFKNNARVHLEVSYVDANEGQSEVFIRCASTDAAQKLISEQMWENMSILEGDAESAYWQKIWKDREMKFKNKMRINVRGRDKLLKRAERELGKHIKFDD